MDIKEKMTSAVDRTIAKNKNFHKEYGADVLYAPDFNKMVYVAKDANTNKLIYHGEFSMIAIYKKDDKLLMWSCFDPYAPEACKKKSVDVSVLYEGTAVTKTFEGPGSRNIDIETAFCLGAYVFDYYGGEYFASVDTGDFIYYMSLNTVNRY